MNVRELLLKPAETPVEIVPLPELGDGVTVRVKGMNARERGAFDMQFVRNGTADTSKQKQMRERMIVACAVDDSGSRMFTIDDVGALGLQRVDLIDRIFEACQRVNGDKGKDELIKN